MVDPGFVTGAEAGLTGDDQIVLALKAMRAGDGVASMPEIYQAVEAQLQGRHLSEQGRASLRRLINKVATDAGYVYKYDPNKPGWRITPEGRELIVQSPLPAEEVFNVDTQQSETISNTARGDAFELYVLRFLRVIHPYHTWYHQGRRKSSERGLDFIGDRIGVRPQEPTLIGAQTKLHLPNAAPTQTDWLKFLAGCFSRRVESALFITSGRLTGEQRREAGEGRVTIIEGREEIGRLAQLYGLERFQLFDVEDEAADEPTTSTSVATGITS